MPDFCASGQTVASVADQSFFRRAIAHDGLAVGNYWADPTSGQKMINFAQQFNDSNGRLAGVIVAGLDLTRLPDHLKGNGLSPTSSKLIADREGNIMGAAFAPYGQLSRFEDEVVRAILSPPNPPLPGIGTARTPLHLLDGMITPSGLHFERSHSGIPNIDPNH